MAYKSKISDYDPVTRPGSRRSADPTVDSGEMSADLPHPSREATEALKSRPAETVPVSKRARTSSPVVGRGHTISFIGLVLFTFVLYFRPYEFSPALAWTLKSAFWTGLFTLLVFSVTQVALEGRLTAPEPEIKLLLLLTVLALLSIPFAIDPSLGWETFNEFMKPVLMFIVLVNVVRTEQRLKILFFLTISVSCLISAAAVRDYASGHLTGERVMGIVGNLFDNPNSLALHLVTIIPLVVALLLSAGNLLKKAIYAAAVLLMVAAVTVSFSRGGFVGLIISLAFLGWKMRKKHRTLVIVIAVLALVMTILLIPSGYGTRLASMLNPSLDPTGSAGQRQELLWRSIVVALRHPVLGIGIGNFPIMGIHALSTHNAYTQVASEIGMTALVLYVMFIVVPFKNLARIGRATAERSDAKRSHYLALGLQASLLAYMVSSFFAHVAYQWYIYYLVGYAVSFGRIYYSTAASRAETDDSHPELTPAEINDHSR